MNKGLKKYLSIIIVNESRLKKVPGISLNFSIIMYINT
jgi:hypothetical protein